MRRSLVLWIVAAWLAATPAAAQSGADSRVTVSGYLQAQYEHLARDAREPTDRGYLRRALLTVDAEPFTNWSARLQVDLGPATSGGKILLRDALLRWNGWNHRGWSVSAGNQKLPFSRSYLTPAPRRGLIERPAPGLRPYGTPGRTVSLRVDGRTPQHRLQWSGAVGAAGHRPDITALRIDGAVESGDDWNEGVISVGRLEWHPFGDTPRDQGGFGGPPRLVVGIAGYVWQNDGDRNLYTTAGEATSATRADLEQALALETSAGFRGGRTSFDVEYHRLAGRTVDPRFDGGLYRDGRSHLQLFAVEGGVMLLPRRVEALAAIDSVHSAAHDRSSYGPAFGLNYYISAHDLKLSLMHRLVYDEGFVPDARARVTYLQAQMVF